jgi:hypothetical protein
MSWVTVGVAGAGLLGGGVKAIADNKQYKRDQLAQSELTRYSPWTGMKGQSLSRPSAFGTVLQGGMTGAMLGQGINAGGAAGAAGAGSAPAMSAMPNPETVRSFSQPVAMNYQGSRWGDLARMG